MVIHPGAVLAGGMVLVTAVGWSLTTRWVHADRTVARLGIAAPASTRVPPPISRALERAAVDIDHRLLLHAWGAVVAVTAALSAVSSGGVVLLAAAVLAPPGAVLAAQGRAARRRARQLPLSLDAVATGLRGGASLRTAIAEAATGIDEPLRSELGTIARRASAGLPLATALSDWAEATDDPHTRLAGAALVVAAELGGPGASAIDAAAASLRDRADADDEVAALSVQARLSAMLLTAAPLAFAFLLTSIDPTSARFLLGTPAGWICIAGGVGLDALGAAWMARLVRSAR